MERHNRVRQQLQKDTTEAPVATHTLTDSYILGILVLTWEGYLEVIESPAVRPIRVRTYTYLLFQMTLEIISQCIRKQIIQPTRRRKKNYKMAFETQGSITTEGVE